METSQSSVQQSATASSRSEDRVDQDTIVVIPNNQGGNEHGSTSRAQTPANPPGDHDTNKLKRSAKSKLRRAALKGDWNKAEPLLRDNVGLCNDKITDGGETALHLAVLEGHDLFVRNLLADGSIDVTIQNTNGNTALSLAASAGHFDIAKELIHKGKVRDWSISRDEVTPLYMAVSRGHTRTDCLLREFGFKEWELEHQVKLLIASIESGMYDLAMSFLKKNKPLDDELRKDKGWTALQVLARSPSAFCAKKQQGLCAPIIGFLKCNKRPETCTGDAYGLLGHLWDIMIMPRPQDVEEGHETSEEALKLPFIAAESGNDGFLVELINRHPDFLYNVNNSDLSIFHIAVKNRNVRIFNLIYELNGLKDMMTTYVEEESGNNILHLAALLAPEDYLNAIPTPPLKMQREVLWYKEVEKIVQPSYRNMKKNKEGQTPNDLFLEKHRDLMKEGEKSIKQTAKSCMLVTILITTLVFTTGFTPPGGYDNTTGAPILANKWFFKVFPISQAVATLSSLSSTVMFLFVLTSRYEKTDFLNSLPCWLVSGVATLLLSIVAMMVEFCTCLLFFEHDLVIRTVILVLFAVVLVIFLILNYSLLVTILGSKCGGPRLFQSENRLLPEEMS